AALLALILLLHAVHQSLRSFFPLKNHSPIPSWLMAVDGGIVTAGVLWICFKKLPSAADIMLHERSVRFGSGVSPILPLLFLAAAVGLWLICFLKRTQLVRYAPAAQPFPHFSTTDNGRGFFELHESIRPVMM